MESAFNATNISCVQDELCVQQNFCLYWKMPKVNNLIKYRDQELYLPLHAFLMA